ncbi:MAG TPA: P1 family peptidase [Gaiellales bacterium]|jgi:L-aminopeptidase/D-esterase-like protein|nr:P1 family peptidase [Gaiellales bacterium]
MTHDVHLLTPSGRPRARALGIPFDGRPGASNAITDVPGVEVGYATLISGDGPLVVGQGPVRTGVTAIHPRGRADPGTPCAAGFSSLNGNGEMTGTVWIEEAGALSLPVTITNTHAVGTAHEATIAWTQQRHPQLVNVWALPVAAETWDGYLNDINGRHVRDDVVMGALDGARSGPIEEGSVGGGTGMTCYQFKGGSGTASRLVEHGADRYAVGVFVQANFGARRELVMAGVPVGRELSDDNPMADRSWLAPPGAGSVIAVVATDAPLLAGQCKALSRRVPLGLARTGTTGSHFSGDIFLAFSTANHGQLALGLDSAEGAGAYGTLRFVPWTHMDSFFEAVVQATEEAVLNALCAGEEMAGADGRRVPGLPHERVRELLSERGLPA